MNHTLIHTTDLLAALLREAIRSDEPLLPEQRQQARQALTDYDEIRARLMT